MLKFYKTKKTKPYKAIDEILIKCPKCSGESHNGVQRIIVKGHRANPNMIYQHKCIYCGFDMKKDDWNRCDLYGKILEV